MISYNFIIVLIVGIRLQCVQSQACQLQTPCILNDRHGNIISPGYPNDYPDDVKLAWLIKAPLGQSVRLVFEDFVLEYSKDCTFDNLALYDGNTTGRPFIGKYCGLTNPPAAFSSSEQLLLVFISDSRHAASGFNISYETVKRVSSCSSNHSEVKNLNIILNESPGTLKTQFNASNAHCIWKIRAPKGHGIRVTFKYINISTNTTCSVNSVSLYNGYSIQENNLMQRFCGDIAAFNLPVVKYNAEKSVIVELKAGQITSWNVQSFVAWYEFIKKDLSKCSLMNNVNENDNIKLTGYHGNFTVDKTWKDMQCRWRINATTKYQIKLKFIVFILENDCRKAYIQVFDGESINRMNRGKFCGPEIPWEIFSTTGLLLVKLFVSGMSKVLSITGTYKAVTTATDRCSTINSEKINTNIQLDGLSGSIMTPNYPSNYPSNFKCVWIINVPVQYRIRLHFKTFEFEGHECRYDYIEVRDGGTNSSASKTGRLCGYSQLPGDVYSSSNKLWIWFSTDHNEEKNGFLAHFQVLLPEPSKCAMVNTADENGNIQVRGSSGFFTSPNYPLPSPAIKCTWHLVVPRDARIIIHFHSLNPVPWCNEVYFAVHDGNCTCNKVLGSFCDNDMISSAVSSGNALTVVFTKPRSSRFSGFNLTYHVPQLGHGVCSAANSKETNNNLHLDRSSGKVTSPDYPYSSFPNAQCTWYAAAPHGYHVQLTLATMNMSCAKNYLEVRDGESTSSPLKGRFCFLKKPKQIFSSGQKLVLRYISRSQLNQDDPNHSGKFVANYRMIKDGTCSGDFDESWNKNLRLSTRYDIVTSPDYPRPYPPNIKCTWKITVPYNSRVELHFRLYSFGGSCSTDFLEVKDGFSSSSKFLGKFCKHAPPEKLQSSGRYMLVHFESGMNSSHYDQRFKLIVSAIDTGNPPQSTFQAVLIMGFMSFAGFVVVSVCLMCVYWLYKKRRTRQRLRRADNSPEPHDLTVLPSIPHPALDDIPDCLIAEDRPPCYDDAVQTSQRDEQELTPEQIPDNPGNVGTEQQVERGLDNPAFTSDPPTYESLYGSDNS